MTRKSEKAAYGDFQTPCGLCAPSVPCSRDTNCSPRQFWSPLAVWATSSSPGWINSSASGRR